MRICRICLQPETVKTYKSFFDEKYKAAEMYIDLFGLAIMENDNYPALICDDCLKSLKEASQLKKVVLLADDFFKNIFKESIPVEPDEQEGLQEILYEDEFGDTYALSQNEEVEIVSENQNTISPQENIETVSPPKKDKVQKETIKISTKSQNSTIDTKIIQCKCGLVFSSKQRLQNHIRIKHETILESEMLPCEMCNKKFKFKEYLLLHIKNMHSNKAKIVQKVPCSVCGKVLSSHLALKNHEERHFMQDQPENKILKFSCDICGERFRLKAYIFNHMNNKHFREKYSCKFCGKKFYKKYEHEDHIRQFHTLERPFICEHEGCEKTFSRRKNLLIHKRVHTGERPYACLFENCDRAFMHFIDRKRHMMTHTGEKPFQCPVAKCEKVFSRKSDLENHKKTVHNLSHQNSSIGDFIDEDGNSTLKTNESEIPMKTSSSTNYRKKFKKICD